MFSGKKECAGVDGGSSVRPETPSGPPADAGRQTRGPAHLPDSSAGGDIAATPTEVALLPIAGPGDGEEPPASVLRQTEPVVSSIR
jgi:hypothetical protein